MELQTLIFIFTLFVTFASFKRHPFQIKVESIGENTIFLDFSYLLPSIAIQYYVYKIASLSFF